MTAEKNRETITKQAVNEANAVTEKVLASVSGITFSLNPTDGGLDITYTTQEE